jgi:hypothetical protein
VDVSWAQPIPFTNLAPRTSIEGLFCAPGGESLASMMPLWAKLSGLSIACANGL